MATLKMTFAQEGPAANGASNATPTPANEKHISVLPSSYVQPPPPSAKSLAQPNLQNITVLPSSFVQPTPPSAKPRAQPNPQDVTVLPSSFVQPAPPSAKPLAQPNPQDVAVLPSSFVQPVHAAESSADPLANGLADSSTATSIKTDSVVGEDEEPWWTHLRRPSIENIDPAANVEGDKSATSSRASSPFRWVLPSTHNSFDSPTAMTTVAPINDADPVTGDAHVVDPTLGARGEEAPLFGAPSATQRVTEQGADHQTPQLSSAFVTPPPTAPTGPRDLSLRPLASGFVEPPPSSPTTADVAVNEASSVSTRTTDPAAPPSTRNASGGDGGPRVKNEPAPVHLSLSTIGAEPLQPPVRRPMPPSFVGQPKQVILETFMVACEQLNGPMCDVAPARHYDTRQIVIDADDRAHLRWLKSVARNSNAAQRVLRAFAVYVAYAGDAVACRLLDDLVAALFEMPRTTPRRDMRSPFCSCVFDVFPCLRGAARTH